MSMNDDLIQPDRGQQATSIHLVNKAGLDPFVKGLSIPQRAALAAQKFTGGGFQVAIVPEGDGWFAVGGVADPAHLSSWCLSKLAVQLPAGTYRLAGPENATTASALHGWQTAQYRFLRYKKDDDAQGPRILLTSKVGAIAPALAEAQAVTLVRDLVNTPAEDMGPAELEDAIRRTAAAHGARLMVTTGDQLKTEYPLVKAVGRAASRSRAPRMCHFTWGDENAPVLAIVGKGVCFDTGGLDIKNASGMALMKKDMGGAAHALALAQLVMASGLKVRLHCLIPVVENAVSGDAFRPGDVLSSRKGLSIEIGNTDAEGRLILADALTRASEENPSFIIDFATLTGAARVALGPDLPALFARREETIAAMLESGRTHDDQCWPLPLYTPYAEWLKSDIADINNAHGNAFAGASVAALFLDRFVGEDDAGVPLDWAHFDTYAWRNATKPGRPKGGDALGLRAAWHMVQERFGESMAQTENSE